MPNITREEAVRLFGLTPLPPLSQEAKARAKEVNDTLDALIARTNIRERELFRRTFATEAHAQAAFSHFLHHVSDCPAEVLAEAERLMASKHEDELACPSA